MGFIHAVYDLGRMVQDTSRGVAEKSEINSFLQLPLPVTSDAQKSGREIRVWLDVADKDAATLTILGVAKVDLVEYPRVEKEKYLYREPVGSNTSWKFSPIYKLGTAVADGKKELLGKGYEAARQEMMAWLRGTQPVFSSKQVIKEIKDNRYFKLKNSLLDAFEEEKVFEPGTVNTIMQYLIDQVDDIVSLWSDKKRSYILIFGVKDNGRFLYPGEVNAFRKYFEKKLTDHMAVEDKEDKTCFCAVCGGQSAAAVTVDKLFTFATFDKPGFLPGSKDVSGAKEKVYPVCQRCFSLICDGREKIKENFRDTQTAAGLFIDVIPEVLFDAARLPKIAEKTVDFLHKGIKREEKRLNKLAEQGEGLVYHFLFWEQNQRQERVHLMVEDVPPTRLKKILVLWQETVKVHLSSNKDESETGSLDGLFKLLYRTLLHLAGKRDEDKKIMRDKWLQITGKLLGGQQVDIYWLKTLLVSRFPGLFADGEWVKKYGRQEVKNMIALVDFLIKANGR
ncbi:TM1802 family CRISPR-associated protein [Desulforamulus putei]|uniref:TM1802 family CRISPR-associated protein n=1 Tax=Desulforamulus putei TaxID=74701 RepID=UPI002FDDE8A9